MVRENAGFSAEGKDYEGPVTRFEAAIDDSEPTEVATPEEAFAGARLGRGPGESDGPDIERAMYLDAVAAPAPPSMDLTGLFPDVRIGS